MKPLFPLSCVAALALLLTSGCAPHYTMTLTNHRTMTTHGKPKVDEKQGVVRYTDAEGKKHVIPLITVQTIEPK